MPPLRLMNPSRGSEPGLYALAKVAEQAQEHCLLFLEHRDTGRSTRRASETGVVVGKRFAVWRYDKGADRNQLPSLETGENQRVGVNPCIGACVIIGVARRWMGLPIINVHEHAYRQRVPLRVDSLTGVSDILPILLIGEGLAPRRRTANEFRFFEVELPSPYQRTTLSEPELR